jgi:hypothetical protein
MCAEFSTKQNSEVKGIMKFIRRLGQSDRSFCGRSCPQILEMADGDFAVVGLDITAEATKAMPPGPGVGTDERVVKIPRRVMVGSRADIPAA